MLQGTKPCRLCPACAVPWDRNLPTGVQVFSRSWDVLTIHNIWCAVWQPRWLHAPVMRQQTMSSPWWLYLAGALEWSQQRPPLPVHCTGFRACLATFMAEQPCFGKPLTSINRCPAGGRLHQAPAPELAGLQQGEAFHAAHIEVHPARATPIERVCGPSVEVRTALPALSPCACGFCRILHASYRE